MNEWMNHIMICIMHAHMHQTCTYASCMHIWIMHAHMHHTCTYASCMHNCTYASCMHICIMHAHMCHACWCKPQNNFRMKKQSMILVWELPPTTFRWCLYLVWVIPIIANKSAANFQLLLGWYPMESFNWYPMELSRLASGLGSVVLLRTISGSKEYENKKIIQNQTFL